MAYPALWEHGGSNADTTDPDGKRLIDKVGLVTAVSGGAITAAWFGKHGADGLAITDDDTAGVQITQTSGSTQVTEGGTTDSYSIALSSQPASNVTVNLSVGNQISLSAATLTFTPANFSTAQTVTVTAVDDNQVEGTHSASISTAVSSADAAYNNASVPDLSVSIADNDAVAEPVVVTPGGSGGGSLGWLLLLPLAAAGLRRRSTASTESGN